MLLAAFLCIRVRSSQTRQLAVNIHRWSHSLAPRHVPVVIVGAGPTGLVLSCLLSQYGIRHMLLERSKQLTQHPQAHYINNRTMEVFRTIPGLSQQVAASSPPLQQWRKFIYCAGMAEGQILGEVDHFPGASKPQDPTVSPEPVTHLSQHRLLPLLLQHAQQLSAANGNCADIQFGHTVTAISNVEFPHQLHSSNLHTRNHAQQTARAGQCTEQDTSGSRTHQQQQQGRMFTEDQVAQECPVCVAVESDGAKQLVRCSYLAAADGANSNIRNLLGIRMSGDAALQHLMSIHFSWPHLGQSLLSAGREAMLYFVFNRQVVGVVVAHDLDRGEFVAQVPYYPPLQSPTDFTEDVCQQLIAAAAGWPLPKLPGQQPHPASRSGFQLHSVKSWVMSALVADEYEAWGERLFLVGDAAHRFPPAGGFGMNTGVQDAHNLAWKLAAVLTGTASHTLLQSYQLERQPVAIANTKLSVSNWQEAIRVPQALGLDPSAATLVNKLISAAPVPAAFSRLLLDSALTAGRTLGAAVTPLRKAALEDILKSGLSLRLQFPKEDLGFVYSQGAIARHHKPRLSASSSSSVADSRSSSYIPSVVVGGRLPHCRLVLLGEHPNGQGEEVSILDVVSPSRLGVNMLLICSNNSNAGNTSNLRGNSTTAASAAAAASQTHVSDWWSAGQQLQQEGWPLSLLQLLPQNSAQTVRTAADSALNSSRSVDTFQNGKQQQQQQQQCAILQAVDVDGSWAALHQGCSNVAVLVRPDGHIAWATEVSDKALRPQAADSKITNSSQSVALESASELRSVLQDVLHLQLLEGLQTT